MSLFSASSRLSRLALLLLSITLTAGLWGCSVLRVSTPTPSPRQVSASADEVARAMQEDRFYSEYRGVILKVSGTVASIQQENGRAILVLATGLDTRAECDLGSQVPALKPGQQITVQTNDTAQAKRLPGAVRLENCSLP